MSLRAAAFAALFGVVSLSPGLARAAGDVATGTAIAKQWCSSCHAVSGAASASDAVPSLAVLAQRPGRTPEWWRGWLTDPHPPMPNPGLSRQDIDHLIAYLQSLRQ